MNLSSILPFNEQLKESVEQVSIVTDIKFRKEYSYCLDEFSSMFYLNRKKSGEQELLQCTL